MGFFLPLFADTSTFLETENLSLIETQICDRQWYQDYYNQTGILYQDQRFACFVTEMNETEMICDYLPNKIALSVEKKFLILLQNERYHRIDQKTVLRNVVQLDCYQMIRDESEKNDQVQVKTKFLGSIKTNRYFAFGGSEFRVSISPDSKYLLIPCCGKKTKDLPKNHRGQYLFLVWEIGDNTIEKDIVDKNGNKIPITIITPEK